MFCRPQPSLIAALVGLFVLALGPVGCGGKEFTPEQFATVTKDMPEAQVLEILGKPSQTMEAVGVRRLFWEKSGKYYSISFADGKVVAPMAHADKEDYQLMIGMMAILNKKG